MNIYINNIAKWKVSIYDYLDPQMGLRSISLTVNHPSNWIDGDAVEVADFTDAYVMYKGEKFKLSISKPTAEKKNSKLDYEYRLVFKGSEDELTRRKVRDLAEVGVNKYISQGTSFSLSASIQQFKQLLDNNLRYYFGNDWNVTIAGESQDSARIDINNTSIWELLQKTYEYYGLRWNIKNKTITIGYEPVLIDHVFDYGKEGGLVKITRTAQDDSTPNRITGTGGSRNLPKNYFTNRYSDFRPDPDVISDAVNIKNLMPRVFRDSVRSGTLPYIDYVEDEQLVALNGVIEDALAPNEDIYPSIAGVEVTGLGRIDEIIYSDIPLYNRPEEDEITEWDEEGNPITPADNYSPTFDIWVKDIGFDLADEKYTSTEEAKISFTTGDLAGYEFTILSKGKRKEGDIVKDKEVYSDTSKSHGGVNSAYRITLIKSDEDFDATNRMLPNTVFYPRAGDSFVIYNIEMPQSYVENAELRLQRWLEAQLEELKTEKPTYAIEIMPSFFKTVELEFDGVSIEDKLEAGNLIRVMNASVTGEMQTLHINNLTVEYKDLLPKYRFTVTDKVSVDGNAVGRLQSQLDAVVSRQLLTEKEIDAILSGFSTKFLSKVRPDIAQQFIQFLKGLTAEELSRFKKGVEFGEFSSNIHTGTGGLIDKDGNAELQSITSRSFIETPVLKYNQLELIGDEMAVGSGAVIEEIEQISETDYRLKLKLEEGDFNPIHQSDILKGIYSHKTSWMGVISETDAESPWIRVTVPADELVHGGRNFPPVQFMTLAKWGNFIDKERQTTLFFSAKDGNIRIFSGVNNYKAGYLNTQVGKAKGLEFIRNWENLPVNPEHGAVYADTLFYGKKIKIDYQGEVIKEYPDRGEWSLETATNNPYLFNGTEEHEVWYQSEKFRVSELGNETLEKPSRTSPHWVLILSIKDDIDESRGSKTFFAKPSKYRKGDRWILTEDMQLLDNFYLKGQILEAVYATNNDSDWRLMLIEGDEEATEGINLIRNYDFREGLVHWGAVEGSIVELEDELPAEFYTPSINVIGDEYGYEYAITSENDELIIFDE